MAKGNYGWGSGGYSTTNSGTNDQVRTHPRYHGTKAHP